MPQYDLKDAKKNESHQLETERDDKATSLNWIGVHSLRYLHDNVARTASPRLIGDVTQSEQVRVTTLSSIVDRQKYNV